MKNQLLITPQLSEHDDVEIEGDETALRKLRNAITDAIKRNTTTAMDTMQIDGEGYMIYVRMKTPAKAMYFKKRDY